MTTLLFSDTKAMLSAFTKSLKETGRQTLRVRAKAAWDEAKWAKQLMQARRHANFALDEVGEVLPRAVKEAKEHYIPYGKDTERLYDEHGVATGSAPKIRTLTEMPTHARRATLRDGTEIAGFNPHSSDGLVPGGFGRREVSLDSDIWKRLPDGTWSRFESIDDAGAELGSSLFGDDERYVVHAMWDDRMSVTNPNKTSHVPRPGYTVSASVITPQQHATFGRGSGVVYSGAKAREQTTFLDYGDAGSSIGLSGARSAPDYPRRSSGNAVDPENLSSRSYLNRLLNNGTDSYNEIGWMVNENPVAVYRRNDVPLSKTVQKYAEEHNLPVLNLPSQDDFNKPWQWTDITGNSIEAPKGIGIGKTTAQTYRSPSEAIELYQNLDWNEGGLRMQKHAGLDNNPHVTDVIRQMRELTPEQMGTVRDMSHLHGRSWTVEDYMKIARTQSNQNGSLMEQISHQLRQMTK